MTTPFCMINGAESIAHGLLVVEPFHPRGCGEDRRKRAAGRRSSRGRLVALSISGYVSAFAVASSSLFMSVSELCTVCCAFRPLARFRLRPP
jgi:hypothetical protein